MSGATCPGCLGTRECWICGGVGITDTEHGERSCHSCGGSRRCRYCLDDDAPLRRATDPLGGR